MNEPAYVALVLSVWNIITLLLYGIDKGRARKHKWRISETTLITCAFIMGGIGALLGMILFKDDSEVHVNVEKSH